MSGRTSAAAKRGDGPVRLSVFRGEDVPRRHVLAFIPAERLADLAMNGKGIEVVFEGGRVHVLAAPSAN